MCYSGLSRNIHVTIEAQVISVLNQLQQMFWNILTTTETCYNSHPMYASTLE